MHTADMYGKSLPVIFVEGYTRIFEDMMGRSTSMSYFQGPAQKLFTDRAAAEEWLFPLYAYFKYNSLIENRLIIDTSLYLNRV
jgi:hypothetical protein